MVLPPLVVGCWRHQSHSSNLELRQFNLAVTGIYYFDICSNLLIRLKIKVGCHILEFKSPTQWVGHFLFANSHSKICTFQVRLNGSTDLVLRAKARKVGRVPNRRPPDRTAMKQRARGRQVERKQQGNKKHTEMSVMKTR